MKKLVNTDNFAESSIREYTGESDFCYVFNRSMRNFEKVLTTLAYYMRPFLFAVNKYVKENPNLKFNRDMTLYRNIQCSIFDFYLYKMNLSMLSFNHFYKYKKRGIPTNSKCQKINNNGISPKDMIKVTMIFNYKHKADNISPGILVLDNKGKNGKCISKTY